MIEHLFGEIEPYVRDYGAIMLFAVLTLESLGLPVPGESALIVAGTLAGQGELRLPTMLLAAWAGAVLGDNIGYLIGRLAGRPLVLAHGSRIGLTEQRFARVESFFARFGPLTVAFARFVNILRQLNGVVAGTMGMDWRVFFLCNAAGGALWVLFWGLGAWWLGSHLDELAWLKERAVEAESAILPAIAISIGAALALRIWLKSKRSGAGSQR